MDTGLHDDATRATGAGTTGMNEDANGGTNGGANGRWRERARRAGERVAAARDRLPKGPGDPLAASLGWFSIALGAAQLIAPDRVARLVGLEGAGRDVQVMRALGARELLSGVGILSGERTAGFLWGRVAGDAMDLALLGRTLTGEEAERGRAVGAAIAVAGVMALDLVAARRAGGTGLSDADVAAKEAGAVDSTAESAA